MYSNKIYILIKLSYTKGDKMIEILISPRRAIKRPWEMFFIGLFYASIALLFVTYVFGGDDILQDGAGLLMVLFTVLACLPFVYYLNKHEEEKNIEIDKNGKLIKEHSKALLSLICLFLGFVIAYSFWYVVLPEVSGQNFNFQIRTFCAINNPREFNQCVHTYGAAPYITGHVTKVGAFLSIFSNNLSVMIFTLIFSLAFGAGAIFILVWNASVIGAAMGMFANGSLKNLPSSLVRYLIHGVPEIMAYFVVALAGGIISFAFIRGDLKNNERKWKILEDSLILILISIGILLIAGFMEVYLTPLFFK